MRAETKARVFVACVAVIRQQIEQFFFFFFLKDNILLASPPQGPCKEKGVTSPGAGQPTVLSHSQSRDCDHQSHAPHVLHVTEDAVIISG